ncbi:hypothetical protein LJC45_03540 [Alistipes sp. OttesenSCG-928-B03]|nr:hypothetical protein [Alistipes sp. OttesenSCG-928-B03]
MKKLLLILIATLFAGAANAQQYPFTYEYKEISGMNYVYFYKKNSISDKELVVHYRINFYSNRSSQSRMATILASGSSDRSTGYDEKFYIQITNYEVKGGGSSSSSQSSSSSSSSGSSSQSSSGITRDDVPPEYWVETDVKASAVVWAKANVGADSPERSGTYIYARHLLGQYNACPEGWRPPTTWELRSLASSKSKWTTVNGVEGRLFYTGSQEVFLPAAGYESGIEEGKKGYYRSDTGVSGEDELWTLIISKGKSRVKGFNRGATASLRCVRK